MKVDVKLYKYYSFMLGQNYEKKKDWRRLDLKIPAFNVYQAMMIYSYLSKSIYTKVTSMEEPSLISFGYDVKQIIEYEKIYRPEHYYTQHQYRQLRVINNHEFGKYLKRKWPKKK